MNAQTHSRLRGVALAALGLLALAGCDRYQKANDAAPAVTAVYLADQTRYVAADRYDPSTTTITSAQTNLTLVRIRFNKTMDPSSIQSSQIAPNDGRQIDPNTRPVGCKPAAGITVTATDAAGAPVPGFEASVCYDPSGPDMVVTPGKSVCYPKSWTTTLTDGKVVGVPTFQALPQPWGSYESELNQKAITNYNAFDRGYTYTIHATGVKDQGGAAVPDFTINLSVPTELQIDGNVAAKACLPGAPCAGVQVATGYDPVNFVTSAYSTPVAAGASVATPVPAGDFDATTGWFVPTNWNYTYGWPVFGADIRVQFDAPMCQYGVTGTLSGYGPDYCDPSGLDFGYLASGGDPSLGPAATIAVGGTPLVSSFQQWMQNFWWGDESMVGAGYDAVSDLVVRGDARGVHLYTVYPLEDAQTYTVTVKGGADSVLDWVGATLANTTTYEFASEPGAARIQVVFPTGDAAKAFPPNGDYVQMSTLDGHGIEFVASRPLSDPAGHVYVFEGDPPATEAEFAAATNRVALLEGDVLPLDNRNRAFVIGGTVGRGDVVLKPAQKYTVVLLGLTAADATPIARTQWSFTTAPFGLVSNDVALGQVATFPAKGTVDPVNLVDPTKSPRLDFLVWGKVEYDAAATQTPAPPYLAPQDTAQTFGASEWTAAIAPLATGGSIKLVVTSCPANEPACVVGADVPGTGGVLLFDANGAGYKPFWQLAVDPAAPLSGDYDGVLGLLPASKLTFVPAAPLFYLAQYELQVSGLKWGANTLVQPDGTTPVTVDGPIKIPFTTRAFQVRRARSSKAGSSGNALVSGGHNITWNGATYIRIDWRGIPNDDDYSTRLDGSAGSNVSAGDHPENAPIVVVDNSGGSPAAARGIQSCTPGPTDPACDTTTSTKPSPYMRIKLTHASTTSTRIYPVDGTLVAPNNVYTVLVKTTQAAAAQASAKAPAFSVKFVTTDTRDANGLPTNCQ